MEQLKKVISLNQAAQISGYTQDYLGYLVRKGEIKGKKIGKTWFTTEAEVKNYIFKQKVRSNEFALMDFLSPSRSKRIIFAAIILSAISISIWMHFFNAPHILSADVKTTISDNGDQ